MGHPGPSQLADTCRVFESCCMSMGIGSYVGGSIGYAIIPKEIIEEEDKIPSI